MAWNRAKNTFKKYITFVTLALWGFSQVFATDYPLDFTNSSSYTVSDSTKVYINQSLAQLKTTLSHTGVITNTGTTLLDGAYEIVVDGNYAYIAASNSDAIEIIDISTPTAPTHVASITDNGGTVRLNEPTGIVKSGNYLYVASHTSDAIQVIDVSTPSSPAGVGQVLNSPTTRRLDGARSLVKSWNYLYVASDVADALVVIDVTTPTAPTYVANARSTTTLNGARDVAISGNYAYVTAYDGDRFTVVDVTTPASPVIVTNIRNNGTTRKLDGARSVAIDGNYAYVTAFNSNALQIIDITTPSSLQVVTNVTTAALSYQLDGARDIQFENGFLYVTGYNSDAINIIDVREPSIPVFVNSITHSISNPLLDGANALYKVGDYIYVASFISDAIEVLDLSYPTDNPYFTNTSAIPYGGGIIQISETLWGNNAWNTRYQISNDGGTTYYYYNGSNWISASAVYSQANSISTINSNLVSFFALSGTSNFKIRGFLNSDGTQLVEIDNILMQTDETGPIIDEHVPIDNQLLAHGDFDIEITYNDTESGVDTTSDTLTLQRWNGSSWDADIAATYVNFWSSLITSTGASYPVADLPYGKYKAVFTITDNFGNMTTSEDIIFYVDEIVWNISQASVDVGTVNSSTGTFSSDELIVTVETVWAGFDIVMRKTTAMNSAGGDTLSDWDSLVGFWYDLFPYSLAISSVAPNPTIATEAMAINSNGDKNVYTYKIKYGALIEEQQQAWIYSTNIAFDISLDYSTTGICIIDESPFGCWL